MIVLACPGQGSQTPGFLTPWLEAPNARDWLGDVSEQIKIDLIEHGTVSDADTIRRTEIAQPLIVAAGILTWNQLRERLVTRDPQEVSFAGHSVGEVTAAYAAGVFDADTAIRFVSARATAMQKCADAVDTGMAAVVGGDPDEVIAHLEQHGLHAANFNGGGQIVAAGEHTQLAQLQQDPPPKARVMPLSVAGAFHTRFMEPAREAMAANREAYTAHAPGATIYTNKDGSQIVDGDEYVDTLISQIASPVRWDLCMDAFVADGATGMVEVTPAGALAGLARRGMRGVPTLKISSPDDLDAAVEFILNTGEEEN